MKSYKVLEVKVEIEQAYNKNYKDAIAKHLNIESKFIFSYELKKKSLDARKKANIHYICNFDVCFDKRVENKVVKSFSLVESKKEELKQEKITKEKTVVVVGSGPAGLFSALTLVKANVNVVLLERGESVENRVKTVNELLKNGKLNTESNIQFGEGGAGTFSDGKLNTGINSPLTKEVLQTFYECGSEENVLYDSKPHVGTDHLRKVVINLRNKIINNGGKVLFNSKFTDFDVINNKIIVKFVNNKKEQEIIADDLVLALGYSARDTLRHLYSKGVEFKQKAFSVGYRIEHLQEDINKAQYGEGYNKLLPPADYKLFTHLKNGRTVYTFCMCPGGEVVPAISGNNEIVTNGMSYNSRAGENANSAILVSVSPEDYENDYPLAGMDYQENLEKQAFLKGKGEFVVSRLEDFIQNKPTKKLGKVIPTIKPRFKLGNVYSLLPCELAESIKQGIIELDKKLKGFNSKDAVLTGIETRSSAPFFIKRQENLSSNINHVFAIGEGAGMAGGIVSSAVDGIKIARKIIENYLKVEENENC